MSVKKKISQFITSLDVGEIEQLIELFDDPAQVDSFRKLLNEHAEFVSDGPRGISRNRLPSLVPSAKARPRLTDRNTVIPAESESSTLDSLFLNKVLFPTSRDLAIAAHDDLGVDIFNLVEQRVNRSKLARRVTKSIEAMPAASRRRALERLTARVGKTKAANEYMDLFTALTR